MTGTDKRLFFDSCIWLGYFLQSSVNLSKLVESPESRILTSVLSFHEVPKVLYRNGRSKAFVKEVIRFMRENSSIANIDTQTTTNAIEWCLKNKLSAMDGIIYQSARDSGAQLITTDSDFDGLSKVIRV